VNRHQENKSVQVFLFLNFVGFLVAFYTLWHHVAINNNALQQASFCNVSSYINCDAVALSSFSSLAGYPVAALLVIFYGVLSSLALYLYFIPKDSKNSAEASRTMGRMRDSILTVTSIGMLVTIVLAALSFFVLKLLCLLCLASYIINLLLWLVAFSLVRKNPRDGGFYPIPPKSAIMSSLIVAGVLALSPLMVRGMVGSTALDDNIVNTVLYQHFSSIPSHINTSNSPSIGPEDARIVVVEYSDFQCPYCARASTVIPEVVRASPGVRFVFKNFPLDPNCNSTMQGRGHALSCLAAKTGHCVFKSGGSSAFFTYEKAVFAQQSSLSSPLIETIALRSSSLTKEELKACVDSPDTHREIVSQVEEAIAVGVTGTPAVYVNGRRLEYGTIPKVLRRVIARYSESLSNAGK
jgi:protein-disulfide isomerase